MSNNSNMTLLLIFAVVFCLIVVWVVSQTEDLEPQRLDTADPKVGTFAPGEYIDSLVSDEYAVIFMLIDGSEITQISVDSVYAVGYDKYHVHVQKDPEGVWTQLSFSDILKIYYIKRGTK